jgi:putative colanic acid biosynthesis acetyltransferase WcaF
MSKPYKTYSQTSAYDSPWSRGEKVRMLLWGWCWAVFCQWTPKPLNAWRLFWLRLFGARLHGKPFVHQRARIQIPWNLVMEDRACLGDRANAYTLGLIEIGARATIAQEAYLCSGTHDFTHPALSLQTAPVRVGEDAFVSARAFVLPGVTIGARAIIGAGSVVTRDVPPDVIAAGNPCRVLRPRDPVLTPNP